MRSMRRRLAATLVVGGAFTLACAVWALGRVQSEAPISGDLLPLPQTSSGDPVQDVNGPPELDLDVFDVVLWNPPPRIEAHPVAAAQVRDPLRLQLLGVVQDGAGLRAALYDPADDQVHLVTDGDSVKRYRVVRVAFEGVELVDGRTTHQLRMREVVP